MATTHEINAKQRAETIAAYNAFHGTNIAYNGVPKHAFSFMFCVAVRSVGMAERVLRLCKTRLSPSISAA